MISSLAMLFRGKVNFIAADMSDVQKQECFVSTFGKRSVSIFYLHHITWTMIKIDSLLFSHMPQ
jgi:hypothetical protein